MHRFTTFIRRPVKRQGAEHYLLVAMLSFAASVTLTRLFLYMTGYPQLGGGELHIAHVLWGGLLLFIASLLPLLFANRWVYMLGAFLAGTGVGLFIDEVGKFITANNDYFYPLAAPIIYVFFLLTVFLYIRVRRPYSRSPRVELYRSMDAIEEVLEHDLDPVEKADLAERLQYVAQQDKEPQLARLAVHLMEYLNWETLILAQERPSLIQRWSNFLKQFEMRLSTRGRLKAILAGGLLSLGIVALINLYTTLPIGPAPTSLERIFTRLLQEGQIRSAGSLNWFLARVVLEATVGLLLMVSAGLIIANRDQEGTAYGYWSLLLSLTMVDLLVFYFDQFSAILTATVQLTLLLALVYYRNTYLPKQ
jgi:hypothetical protein